MGSPNKNSLNPPEWVNEYADYLYKFAFYRVNDSELAEDLVQDTFLSALNASNEFNGLASEKTWLSAILKNKIIDHYKKASTQMEKNFSEGQPNYLNYENFFDDKKNGHWQKGAMPKEWEEPAIELNKKEFQSVFEMCLNKVPVKWRGIFTMCVIDELDAKLICKEFELTSSNFWVIIHRIKLQLRACLEKNWLKL
ncbi:MAG: sigma-70 family RNA polymerase sigma factor [Sphingobacteriaceae bacterium]|nr:sigma-70 family RNA polymerase sigma factor [Sphingobacteriaceae bacterium]